MPPNTCQQHPSCTLFAIVHANTNHTYGTRNTAHTLRKRKQQLWTSTLTNSTDKHSLENTVRILRTNNHSRALEPIPYQRLDHPLKQPTTLRVRSIQTHKWEVRQPIKVAAAMATRETGMNGVVMSTVIILCGVSRCLVVRMM